jgi:curved DNA-binding protein CbpA
LAKTHYEVLEIARTATPADVKSAYRKIVLQHHPDRSQDPRSQDIFLRATESYNILADPERRRAYDEALDLSARRAAERDRERLARSARNAAQAQPGWRREPDSPSAAAEIQKLTLLFSRGRHSEAETLARQISQVHPRHPVPYAILGDIARLRGHLNEAARMYAYAAQFEPNNPVYQRRYEELLNSSRIVEVKGNRTQLQAQDRKIIAPIAGGFVVLVAACYVSLSREGSVLGSISPVSTWTLGTIVMLFLSGVSMGVSLHLGNLLDRFESVYVTSTGRLAPNVALGLVAAANFWAACLLYLVLGLARRAFNFSTTRLLLGVTGATLLLTFGAATSLMVDALQVLTWGGNLVYLGAIVGWMVADAFVV